MEETRELDGGLLENGEGLHPSVPRWQLGCEATVEVGETAQLRGTARAGGAGQLGWGDSPETGRARGKFQVAVWPLCAGGGGARGAQAQPGLHFPAGGALRVTSGCARGARVGASERVFTSGRRRRGLRAECVGRRAPRSHGLAHGVSRTAGSGRSARRAAGSTSQEQRPGRSAPGQRGASPRGRGWGRELPGAGREVGKRGRDLALGVGVPGRGSGPGRRVGPGWGAGSGCGAGTGRGVWELGVWGRDWGRRRAPLEATQVRPATRRRPVSCGREVGPGTARVRRCRELASGRNNFNAGRGGKRSKTTQLC